MATFGPTHNPRFSELLSRSAEIKDLDGVLGLLSWDEETYAPPGARAQRGLQTATVEAIRHQRTIDPALGELISALLEDASLNVEEKTLVERVKRKRDLATKLPESLVKELAATRSISLDAWQ